MHGQSEHQRAQQHLRPLGQRIPSLDESVVGFAPRQGVDHDHPGRPGCGPPVRCDVGDPGRGGAREKHRAVEISVHQLVRTLRRSAQHRQLVDQVDRPLPVRRPRRHPRRRRQRLQRPLLPGRAVGGNEHIDVRPRRHRCLGEKPWTFQFGGGLVQTYGGRHHFVVPWLRSAGHECVCPPARYHIAPVGGADRAGYPHTVDEQCLADLRRPRGAGMVGDHRQHHLAAAPATLPTGTELGSANAAQPERRQDVLRRRLDSHPASLTVRPPRSAAVTGCVVPEAQAAHRPFST